MAEIRVAPQRRNRLTAVLVIVAIALLAALAWYFLLGPGVGT